MLRLWVFGVGGALLLPIQAQQEFPQWRGSNVLLHGEWIASPIVAVGDVSNVAPYGEQAVDRLPWPMSPNVHRLYWCEGDFTPVAVIKGKLSPQPRKYLWASGVSGCKLWSSEPRLVYSRFSTRVWFLREEGEFLRPTFDGGTHGFIGLLARWNADTQLSAQQRLGALLLTPSANSENLDDYGRYLWQVGDIACELLGKSDCIRRLRILAESGNATLRESACGFLKGQLGQDCNRQ